MLMLMSLMLCLSHKWEPGLRLSANQRALMLMSAMSSLNISISISIRRKLVLMLISQLSSPAHKVSYAYVYAYMPASLVRTGL